MNLAALRTEFKARGFDEVSDTRATQYLNDAQTEINEAADWPWLETVTSGPAPLTIADVREVLYVIDTVTKRKLWSDDVRTITDRDPDFTTAGVPNTTGSPETWWLDGLTTVRVYPANTSNTLSVRYLKIPPDLSADVDIPVIPPRYHSLIVDVAQAIAGAKDESDDRDEQLVRAEVDRAVGRISGVVLNRPLDNPPSQVDGYGQNC